MINEEALKSIEKLHEMKANEILSEAEFEQAKAKLLQGVQPVARQAVAKTELNEPGEGDYLGWMLLPLKRYAQFTGRSSCKEFWMFLLFLNLATLGMALLAVALGEIAIALWLLGFLGIMVPYVAVQVRRFHDQGKSGWLALLNLIPYVGAFIVLVFMALPGATGDNEYGGDPLQR